MTQLRTPRSTTAATELLERYAVLDGQIAAIEANRRESIAAVNARADTAANDLMAQRDAIASKVQPWWQANAAELTEGKRKSIELGGCIIGSRSGRASLTLAGAEQDVVDVLSGLRWAKPLLRVKVSLDRAATMRSLDGKHAVTLAELGIARKEGDETFFIERVQQGGTLAGAS
jgi:phage host-nuclease inhibitor protein Gam